MVHGGFKRIVCTVSRNGLSALGSIRSVLCLTFVASGSPRLPPRGSISAPIGSLLGSATGYNQRQPRRRVGRVAEGGGLLNRYRIKSSIGGSNPPLSAITFNKPKEMNSGFQRSPSSGPLTNLCFSCAVPAFCRVGEVDGRRDGPEHLQTKFSNTSSSVPMAGLTCARKSTANPAPGSVDAVKHSGGRPRNRLFAVGEDSVWHRTCAGEGEWMASSSYLCP